MKKLATLLVIITSILSYSFGVEEPQVEKPKTEQENCVTEECHIEQSSKEIVHDPVDQDSCIACHEVVDVNEHTYELIDEEPELCTQCHDEFSKNYVHSALDNNQCSQCHEIHTSENTFRLRAATVGEICAECHEIAKDATHVHGPTSVGGCTLCHDAHESDYENRLVRESNQLCLFCHVTTKEELEGIEFAHEALQDNCVCCHDPHGADNWEMLKDEAPELCYSCHEEIKTVSQTSTHKHNAALDLGGCLNCHTPHASSVRSLLTDVPENLCLTCHDKDQGMNTNEVLPAFTDQIKDKKYLHGPIEEGNCGGCHSPHGSDNFRLLIAEYPTQFYTSFDEIKYELCFGCHERTLVQTSTTEDLTDFRNGNQNLHFLHVNKEPYGRTCRACHQIHASNQPKHIRESVAFGGWTDLPINFSKTDTGGSCSPGCHLPKAYDRQSAGDYTGKPASSIQQVSSD